MKIQLTPSVSHPRNSKDSTDFQKPNPLTDVQAEPQQKRRYTDFYYRRLQGENDRNSERYKVLNSSVEFHNVSIAERRRTTNWEPADSWNPSEGKPQPVLMTSNTRLSIPDHSSVAADEQHLPSKLPSPLDIIREYDQSTTPAQKPGTDHTQELSFNQLRRFHLRRATEMPSSVLTGGIRKIRETDQVMESFFAEEITPNARCPPKPIEQELLPEKGTNNQSGVIPTHERWTIPNSETHEQPAGTTNKEANPPLVSELEELPMPYRLLLAEVDGQAENFNQNQRQRPQLRHKPKPPNQRKGFDNSLSLNDKPNPVVDQIMKDAECDEEYIYDTYIYQPRARMVDLESMQGRIGLLIVDNEVRSRLEVFEEGNSSEDECHLGEEDENGTSLSTFRSLSLYLHRSIQLSSSVD